MTVGKISGLCWTVFVVMCLGFLPLAVGIMDIHAIPTAPRLALTLVVVILAWWGPFAYAMYLAMAVMRNGDRRTLKRGIHGTAEVLTAKATNEVIQAGEYAWQAPQVYKYRLRVTLPGRSPYETSCSICASGIHPGAVVDVAVGRHNRKRVTIDVGQGGTKGQAQPSDTRMSGMQSGMQSW
jgi:hypothetical protein